MRISTLIIAFASGCCALATKAEANEIQPLREAAETPDRVAEPFALAETVSDELLDQQRGGFVIHGMNVNLGADIRTYINGELMLRTTVSWTDAGVLKEQFAAQGISSANAASLNASALANGKISMDVGGTPVFAANDGQTMLVHRVENGLQNILVNTASNLDIIQQVDASVELGGYEAFHDSIMSNRLSDSISSAIGAMTIGAAFGQ
ncbi:hypothetical protein DXH95_07625 [Sphingorhabdus pulchriflava]|uniref:Uncharacterized protein n=1 Tax=Sphingorhabdus pulchriflava TaxID=2292257 RepID=A0A371BI88_9SPHN|nr:hypothetical protein [Sphingorhabdus pulchriflava]RDV07227.1 hypothetical protein DXH95_07625 [Sphingorhabdus pulchriflava]